MYVHIFVNDKSMVLIIYLQIVMPQDYFHAALQITSRFDSLQNKCVLAPKIAHE